MPSYRGRDRKESEAEPVVRSAQVATTNTTPSHIISQIDRVHEPTKKCKAWSTQDHSRFLRTIFI
jgi:hypothetical protein